MVDRAEDTNTTQQQLTSKNWPGFGTLFAGRRWIRYAESQQIKLARVQWMTRTDLSSLSFSFFYFFPFLLHTQTIYSSPYKNNQKHLSVTSPKTPSANKHLSRTSEASKYTFSIYFLITTETWLADNIYSKRSLRQNETAYHIPNNLSTKERNKRHLFLVGKQNQDFYYLPFSVQTGHFTDRQVALGGGKIFFRPITEDASRIYFINKEGYDPKTGKQRDTVGRLGSKKKGNRSVTIVISHTLSIHHQLPPCRS